jgi:hypothetical protein
MFATYHRLLHCREQLKHEHFFDMVPNGYSRRYLQENYLPGPARDQNWSKNVELADL